MGTCVTAHDGAAILIVLGNKTAERTRSLTHTNRRMRAQGNLGVRVSVLDATEPAPAAIAAHQTVGSFTDAAAIEEFVRSRAIDVLTVEIEHIDVDAVEAVAAELGVEVQPSVATLRTIQDKLLQKEHFARAGVAVPQFMGVTDEVLGPPCLRAREQMLTR